MLKSFISISVGLFLAIAPVSFADQIDSEAEAGLAPQGVLVKVNPENGLVEVFRADVITSAMSKTGNPELAAKAAASIERTENKVGEFQLPTNELDKEVSTEACYWRWSNSYWGWGGWNSWNYYRPWNNCGYFGYNNYRYNYSWSYSWNNCNYGWFY